MQHNAQKGHKYVSETVRTKRRMRRMHNCCAWIVNNFDQYDGRHVPAALIRGSIRKSIKYQLTNLNGDTRAHGDALGAHGLNLLCAYEGTKRQVVMDKDNLQKCKNWLAAGHLKEKPKQQRVAEGQNLTSEEIATVSPRHLVSYFFKDGIVPIYDIPDSLLCVGQEKFIEELADRFRDEKFTAAEAAQKSAKYLEMQNDQIKQTLKPAVSEMFRRLDVAYEAAKAGNFEDAINAVFPNLNEKKKDHVLK